MSVATGCVRLDPLFEAAPRAGDVRGADLPRTLRDAYGSDLPISVRDGRPTIVGNFVTTLDGVVSYNTAEAAGGGEISGFFEPDAFVMALLRGLADAVLIGAGTLRAAPGQTWAADFTHPPSAAAVRELRQHRGLPPQPTTVVVTASGDLDLAHKGLASADVPVLIVTTRHGQRALRAGAALPAHIDVVEVGREAVDASALVEVVAQRGMSLVLCEGGPTLIGQLLRERLLDELFLTIAPQVAGRAPATPRLGLVEGTAFTVESAPWARLVDVRKSGGHLFLRYAMEGSRDV